MSLHGLVWVNCTWGVWLCLPQAVMGGQGAKPRSLPWLPKGGTIIHQRFSLVIGDQAKTCRIIFWYAQFIIHYSLYTSSFPVATTVLRIGKIITSSTRMGLRRLYEIENVNLKYWKGYIRIVCEGMYQSQASILLCWQHFRIFPRSGSWKLGGILKVHLKIELELVVT